MLPSEHHGCGRILPPRLFIFSSSRFEWTPIVSQVLFAKFRTLLLTLRCATLFSPGAAGLIYGYTAFIPMALYLALRYFGSESANLLECWALYGYANLTWIPVALIAWSPLTVLNWVFVGVGFGLSAAFLLRNLYPVLSATDRQTSKILLVLVLALHTGLAVAIKVFFFEHGSPLAKDDSGNKPGNASPPRWA